MSSVSSPTSGVNIEIPTHHQVIRTPSVTQPDDSVRLSIIPHYDSTIRLSIAQTGDSPRASQMSPTRVSQISPRASQKFPRTSQISTDSPLSFRGSISSNSTSSSVMGNVLSPDALDTKSPIIETESSHNHVSITQTNHDSQISTDNLLSQKSNLSSSSSQRQLNISSPNEAVNHEPDYFRLVNLDLSPAVNYEPAIPRSYRFAENRPREESLISKVWFKVLLLGGLAFILALIIDGMVSSFSGSDYLFRRK